MAKNDYVTDQQDILDAIADMSFLPPEAKDENLGREFPKIKQGENIFRFVYSILFTLSVITFMILLFIYAPNARHFNTSSTGDNYGIFGVLMLAAFALIFWIGQVFGYRFDVEYSNNKDHFDRNKALHATCYYLALAFFYVVLMQTCLRPNIFSKFLYGNWFTENLGTITLIIMLLVCAGGICLNFFTPKVAKWYNYFVLAVGLWVVVFFTPILSKTSSLSSNYGILFFVLGAICGDLAVPFLIAEKKTGCRSAFQIFLSFVFFFETAAVLDYAMVTLS